jgi:hypothetical protein
MLGWHVVPLDQDVPAATTALEFCLVVICTTCFGRPSADALNACSQRLCSPHAGAGNSGMRHQPGRLNVMDCSVSDEAVAALHKALPTLAVSHTRALEATRS